MADETKDESTESTEAAEKTAEKTSEVVEKAKERETFEDILKSEMGEKKEKVDTKSTEKESDKETETKPSYKKTGSERVQQAVNEKNEAIKAKDELIEKLEGRLESIEENISKQVKPEKVEEKPSEKVVAGFDEKALRDKLDDEGYSESEINKEVKQEKRIFELEQQLNRVTDWADGLIEKDQKTEFAKTEKVMYDNLEKMSKEFPHLFDGENANGVPKLKKEYDEKLGDLLEDYAVYYEGEDKPDYPILYKERAMRTLFREINQPINEAQKAKEAQRKEERKKNDTVEGAEVTTSKSDKKKIVDPSERFGKILDEVKSAMGA